MPTPDFSDAIDDCIDETMLSELHQPECLDSLRFLCWQAWTTGISDALEAAPLSDAERSRLYRSLVEEPENGENLTES
jgi:hypothetical protein